MILALFLLALLALSGGVWRYGYVQAVDQLAQRGASDLRLAASRLTTELQRYQELVVLLARHPVLAELPSGDGDPSEAKALLLEALDKTAALDLVFVDRQGAVLAAAQPGSDTIAPVATAPYFQRALHGALGEYHGYSKVHGRRVYYMAAPVFADNGKVVGALVVVVNLEDIEDNWQGSRPAVFFTGHNGVVIVSNRSELVFRQRGQPGEPSAGLTLPDGSHAGFASYSLGDHRIWLLDWGPYLPKRALHLTLPLYTIDMTAEALVDLAPARRLAMLQTAAVAALSLAFAMVLFQVLLRRQVLAEANAVLEDRVAQRTLALSQTNVVLRREVTERQEAEAALKQAQADLVQAGKLSALGEMSAGISHELNQPLMAIQQFAENGEQFMARGKTEIAAENLTRISGLAKRMARIIRNLRAFARNESEPMGRVDIVAVIDAALELTGTRLRQDGVAVHWQNPGQAVLVTGGEVRLGQVLVNLITNAADAMVDSDPKRLTIAVSAAVTASVSDTLTGMVSGNNRVRVTVSDTGPGIAQPDKIFDPFFSTKEVGKSEGMGLGLSISYGLVQSFGGNIKGRNTGSGAEFSVELEPWTSGAKDKAA